MSAIAIIPARGGSKRIPHKNIKEFCGKPILAYSIQAALESSLFDTIMVSTDDDAIANVARQYGAEVPFFRSEKTANDYAILKEVLLEVLKEYKKQGREFDEICCILPTAPFVTFDDLIESKKMLEKECTSVLPIVKFSYTIFRSLKMDGDRKVEMFWPENYSSRSQDLPEAFHDAGLFYWYKKEYFAKNVIGFGNCTIGYEISEMQCQDIDTEEDWKMAEMKFKFLETRI